MNWLDFSHSADSSDSLQQPSTTVALSGIYEVQHGDGTKSQAVFLRGQQLPPCACCGRTVRYRLEHSAPYIFDDEDFAN